MAAMRSRLPVLLLGLAAFAACGEDDDRPSSLAGGGSSGTQGTGARGGRGGSSGSTEAGQPGAAGEASGGAGASAGDAGSSGLPPVSGFQCGDGVRAGAEQCDLDDFGQLSCASFGFDSGSLGCGEDCAADTSGCVGDEHCADGLDNDGDDLVDCDDDDCADACDEPCSEPAILPDPGIVSASTEGRTDVTTSSCAAADEAGPEAAYRFVAAQSGTLEIELATQLGLVVAVHDSCSASSVELSCEQRSLSLPVSEGDELYIVVEGTSPDQFGEYSLKAFSRDNDVCGDGYRDPGEACDDGNLFDFDGCSTACALESVETEDNDTSATADPFTNRHFAAIDPAGDVDFVAVTLDHDMSSIVAEVAGIGRECELNRIDSVIQLLDSDGTTELGADDDSGDGRCSRLVVTGLDAGTYFVRVAAFGDEGSTFPYELRLRINRCGDLQLGPGEQCDDGNTEPGDGCSATCQGE